MPDDNRVVWLAMYPDKPGAVTAPINFVLFSQGGLFVVFGMMFVVGCIIGMFWYLIVNSEGGLIHGIISGTLLILFTLHLSIDSLRNSVVVSYGFIWAGLLVVLLYLLACFGEIKKIQQYAE